MEWPASAIFYYLNTSANWTNNRWDTDLVGLLTNFLELYYKNDGTNQEWPKIGESSPRSAEEWLEKIPNMEARCLADNIFQDLMLIITREFTIIVLQDGDVQLPTRVKEAFSQMQSVWEKVVVSLSNSTMVLDLESGLNHLCSDWQRHTLIWPKHITKLGTQLKLLRILIWFITEPVCLLLLKPTRRN